jgi:tetratricopeptide (TPR) repeat protein
MTPRGQRSTRKRDPQSPQESDSHAPLESDSHSARGRDLQPARWKSIIPIALLVLIGAASYANSLSGPFIYDDQDSIEENVHLRPPWSLSQVLSAPPQSSFAGRPVVSASAALNYAAGELDVRGYHLVNIAIHILAALVLFGIVRRTLLIPALRSRFERAAPGIAFICALLWLVHPLQTEVVNYVTQRTESLMGLFYLLTLYCAIRAFSLERAKSWYGVAILACALGMASKESMVTAPLIVLLYDAAFAAGSLKRALRTRGILYAGLAATWILLAGLNLSGPRSDTVGLTLGVGAWEYLLNQSQMIVNYLRLVVWPHPLALDYGRPRPLELGQAATSSLFIAVLFGATLAALVKTPKIGFLGAWFFVTLAPTSSLVPIVSEVGAERRIYVPLAGLVVLAVVVGYLALERLGKRLRTRRETGGKRPVGGRAGLDRAGSGLVGRGGGALALTLAVLLAGLTVRRNRDYRSEVSIWESAVRAVPDNYRAHYSLGEALQSEGRDDAAERAYREALRLDPRHARSHHNLAVILRARGEEDLAIRHYRLALETRPDFAVTHFNLGNSLYARGDTVEAMASYREAIAADPDLIEAYTNLGILLQSRGRRTEAIQLYRRSLEIDPEYARGHYNLAGALELEGDLEEAIAHYRRAVEIQPDYARAHYMLALALRATGRLDEAVRHMELFRRYSPDPRRQENE